MTERGRIPALAFEGDERPRFALRDPEPLVNVARGRPEEHQRVERPVDDDAEQATQLPVDLWFLGMSFVVPPLLKTYAELQGTIRPGEYLILAESRERANDVEGARRSRQVGDVLA